MKKIFLCLISATLLTGCADVRAEVTNDCAAAEDINYASETVYEAANTAGQVENTYVVCESGGDSMSASESRALMYAPYEKFGMVYDRDHNLLTYEGEYVRWFEDYYSIGDGTYAGADFFDRTGTVDVYAVRDFSKITVSSDGSYDPGGELTGLKKFSQEEFDSRDIDTLLHTPAIEAVTTAMENESESETNIKLAAEYAPFGLAYYDTPNGGWYYKGEKIRSFRDILTSNGENMNSGKFHGVFRCFGSDTGTVNLTAVRDYDRPDAEGYGTLTGIKIVEEDSSRNIILNESPSSAP